VGLVLSTRSVAPLDAKGAALLGEAADAGATLAARLGAPGGPDPAVAGRGARFVYRRWVLESLLVLGARGPMGFNDLRRALGGLAGESLASKLDDLALHGLLERERLPGPARRVRLGLTPRGERLACATYALVIAKSEHARLLAGASSAVRAPAPVAGLGSARALRRFVACTARFAREHGARAPPAGLEDGLATARRFAKTCVRRWHGETLAALAFAGPLRFTGIRARLGAGDEALTRALSELSRLRAVERTGGAYAITAEGRFDVAMGLPIPLLASLHAA